MTVQQLHLFSVLGLALFVAVAGLTRATRRRVVGALAGAAVGGVAVLGVIALGEDVGWWHMAITWEPYFLTALLLVEVTQGGLVFLLTWRVARRFGRRGLAVVGVLAAVLGPVRNYQYAEWFPELVAYAPGVVPVLAVSGTYLLLGTLGHGVMRLVAGPADADRLARRPWRTD